MSRRTLSEEQSYSIEARGSGCKECGANEQYDVVFHLGQPDEEGMCQSWGDHEEAEVVCDVCNDAFAKGRKSVDRRTLWSVVSAIDAEISGRMWLIEGRGSYEWDDDTYKKEFGWAIHALQEKLEPLREICHDLPNCPETEKGVDSVRKMEQENASLRTQAEQDAREIERLKTLTLTCCFCGEKVADLESLRAHSGICEDHPVHSLRAQLAESESRLAAQTAIHHEVIEISACERCGNLESRLREGLSDVTDSERVEYRTVQGFFPPAVDKFLASRRERYGVQGEKTLEAVDPAVEAMKQHFISDGHYVWRPNQEEAQKIVTLVDQVRAAFAPHLKSEQESK